MSALQPDRLHETPPGPGRPAVTLCLHLGAHKTATSLIQARLAALGGRVGGRLGGRRFTYVGNAELKDHGWARWCRGRRRGTMPERDFAERVAAWAAVPGGLVIVSAEDFLGTTALFDGRGLYPEAGERLDRLQRLIAGRGDVALRPLLYIRRTAAFLAGCRAQEAAKGRPVPAEALAAIEPDRFRWLDLVLRIEAALGPALPVRDYAAIARLGGHGYVAGALAAFGLPAPSLIERLVPLGGLADAVPEPVARRIRPLAAIRRPNASLSARGIALAEAMRPHLDPEEWATLARPFLARHFGTGAGEAAFALDPALAARLDRDFAEDLARLGDRLTLSHPPLGAAGPRP